MRRTDVVSSALTATITVPAESAEARRLILDALEARHQAKNPILPGRLDGDRDLSLLFSVEPVSECRVAKTLKLCETANRAQDVILHTWGISGFYSRSYACSERALKAHAVFLVRIRRVDANVTELEVSALDTWVSNGRRWGFGHGGFGSYEQTESVAPTGVEEGIVARYLERAVMDALQKNTRGGTADQ